MTSNEKRAPVMQEAAGGERRDPAPVMPNETGREAPGRTPLMQDGPAPPAGATVKCLVWDLDNTLWDGILLEDERVRLRPGIRSLLETLDQRGILHSIASRNEPEQAAAKLRDFGIDHLFLHPQIGWQAKASSIQRIAARLNLGLEALAFIDDDPFERDQVRHALPQVRVFDARESGRLAESPDFHPRFVTDDARRRREMYTSEIERQQAEEVFAGPQEAFLATLKMRLSIARVGPGDLERAEELTVRTHQLNSTGYTFDYAELDRLRTSPGHRLLIVELEDRYGSYGKIGLALLALGEEFWTIRLLLMSCRVMSRGVGTVLLNHILASAREAGKRVRAEFIPTKANRQMYVTLRFGGFSETGTENGVVLLEADPAHNPVMPPYVQVVADA